MSPLTSLTSCHCIVCKLCLFWPSVLVVIVQSATYLCIHLTVNAEGTLQREEWIVSTLQVPSGEAGPWSYWQNDLLPDLSVTVPPGVSVKIQWSLQVEDDVSDLYKWETTSVISTPEKRRQWSLQLRDDVRNLYSWKTTSVISAGERRRQWSLQLRDDVSDLYRWKTTSVISTAERRRQKSICNGVVERRRTVTQAAESVKTETTAGGQQQSGFIVTAADNFQHTQNRRRLFVFKVLWHRGVYRTSTKNVKNSFINYIIDCTHIISLFRTSNKGERFHQKCLHYASRKRPTTPLLHYTGQ